MITAYLGRSFYDISPYRDEIHECFFFRAAAPLLIDEKWVGGKNQGGGVPPIRFEFFWIPLPNGHVLQSGQGALLGRLSNLPITAG